MPRSPRPAGSAVACLGLVLCVLLSGLLVPSSARAARPSSQVTPLIEPVTLSDALPEVPPHLAPVVAPAVASAMDVASSLPGSLPGSLASPGARLSRKVVLGRMLDLVNILRSVPQKCGKKLLPSVGPVRRNKRLNRAAKRYAKKMARNDWFDHDAPDGADPGERISAEGYRWSRWGENIAAGYDEVPLVLTAWMASPGHCRTLMGSYQHVGFGHAYSKTSTFGHYWVQDFASPR